MAKNYSSATSVRLMLILLVLLVFVWHGGILGQGGPSKCSNPAAQRNCPPISDGGS
uniref:BLN1-2 n=1 Tax=Hordeum vulgare subsp. vulgare TaxID=112509 RepID=B8X453_HORVV|nr:BLN1-2 [Hordeum vulgare subsp. vulgare]ACJ44987.1 BLN1-2 [Hordeum vulgare subsp. vulgare]ACJ44988.1 BLN1-2 [Hordeum vulgare subsp. vulgare]